ncbi:ribosome maturation factor RimM [Nitrosomonas sp.]|uniref:ribosome maturation factor RimM n=1 Tax=Nitrosomonas sp. TaxID=42353 RepID=UPI002841BD0F|nr:ribosome maturation factor RimM [Nitrosomonas sp.]MDR4513711.1 ribosome maturation factor RimM [Nitrosomonas sp.]
MIIMGHVVNAFGIQGWIRVYPYTETVDGLLDYPSWWLGRDETEAVSETNGGDWIEKQVISGRINGTTLDAKLKGCNNRDQALQLKGLKIAVPREYLPDLPDNGEAGYYWSDLVGAEVVNLDGIKLGTVAGLFETGANDVLRVRGTAPDAKELLIPFIETTVIKKVDLTHRKILVDWEPDY